ncbi:MAG: virulence protein RhuM/Fic/DOC family protein [Spirochaetales bacterium]|jgi:prophage maintenance system killer protein|nr:virulence protein RhuM/Fic/DOC family protein [Spirochaetales bacterium]
MTFDKGEIVLYENENGLAVDVRLQNETVWLSQTHMQELFGRERSVVTKHINNIFKEGELVKDTVCAKFAHTATDGKTYQVNYYNLDVIISVGYRVKSLRGTQFRIWATSILKDHLVRGYTVNQKRLAEKGITEATQMVELLRGALAGQNLVTNEGRSVLELVSKYSRTWQLLWQYDEDSLPTPKGVKQKGVALGLDQTRMAITNLKEDLLAKNEATEIFSQERGEGLAGILGAIEQTFDNHNLYPTVLDKAAHLLYFIIKDHPFVDGNKRIGSFLFLLFLRLNNCAKIFEPVTMVALTLLVAGSEANQKDLLIRLIMNLLETESRK